VRASERNRGALRRAAFAFALAVSSIVGAGASAQVVDYPTRPVRWLVGFSAGGSSDIVARLVSAWLQERMGQPFLVDNRPGAGSNIATEAVVTAVPDGYTLGSLTSANAINATVNQRSLSFDLNKQMVPVAGSARGPNVMVVHPSVPAKTVAEFIAYAKANPGKINMGSAGPGTTSHLAGELFKAMAGVDLLHVPYRGSAPAITDLVAGQVQVMFDAMITTLPHIQAGKLRALGVTTATRSQVLAEVPSIAETVPGYEAVIWYGVGAPLGTPPEIVAKLNREMNAALASAKLTSRLAELGAAPIIASPQEFGAFVRAETEKWEEVVRTSGTKVD
jgi:tripartite-type tricarboxylate transporter receptor subunit TctC